jgi:L-fucose mutarotase/ribose pyranase (RbsD/FucU family)
VKPIAKWEKILDERLPLFGHRNWIVVADAAYPTQSSPGIETIISGVNQQVVIETVLARLLTCKHVRPVIHVDRELTLVDEKDAPGIDSYRNWLKGALKGLSVTMTPHEEIISKLDRAARMFSILIVKSTMTIPYTSVFIELGCGYWDADSEARLRSRM